MPTSFKCLYRFVICFFIFCGSACQTVNTVSFKNPDGSVTEKFRIEIAKTPAQIKRGLMYRKTMPEEEGMLFVFPDSKIRSFWMENTYIPLDMIFINERQRVVSIQHNTVPLTRTQRKSTGPAMFVLEINAGLAKRYGIVPGSLMQKR